MTSDKFMFNMSLLSSSSISLSDSSEDSEKPSKEFQGFVDGTEKVLQDHKDAQMRVVSGVNEYDKKKVVMKMATESIYDMSLEIERRVYERLASFQGRDVPVFYTSCTWQGHEANFFEELPDVQELDVDYLKGLSVCDRMDLIERDFSLLEAFHRAGVLHGDRAFANMIVSQGKLFNLDFSSSVLIGDKDSRQARSKIEQDFEHSLSLKGGIGHSHVQFITSRRELGMPLDVAGEIEQEGLVATRLLFVQKIGPSGWDPQLKRLRDQLQQELSEMGEDHRNIQGIRFERLIQVLQKMTRPYETDYSTEFDHYQNMQQVLMGLFPIQRIEASLEDSRAPESIQVDTSAEFVLSSVREAFISQVQDTSLISDGPSLGPWNVDLDSPDETLRAAAVHGLLSNENFNVSCAGVNLGGEYFVVYENDKLGETKKILEKVYSVLLDGDDAEIWGNVWKRYFSIPSDFCQRRTYILSEDAFGRKEAALLVRMREEGIALDHGDLDMYFTHELNAALFPELDLSIYQPIISPRVGRGLEWSIDHRLFVPKRGEVLAQGMLMHDRLSEINRIVRNISDKLLVRNIPDEILNPIERNGEESAIFCRYDRRFECDGITLDIGDEELVDSSEGETVLVDGTMRQRILDSGLAEADIELIQNYDSRLDEDVLRDGLSSYHLGRVAIFFGLLVGQIEGLLSDYYAKIDDESLDEVLVDELNEEHDEDHEEDTEESTDVSESMTI
jgi:hypothetical protein